ncbi:DUF4287 domain-containing protein [Parasphingopyxis sp. CP4]|uniref:DUF4287 domain-containing protein n=1 Tax=Parasphingopyxis sp. CP4 TaxID=2724527 RepID=UPI0015A0A902|nr:DUF4287 domain-containing protein [Parasphingopyxis sp. CP4]QLC21046.1 DUF4287 domain-containing protein [Parasphingopyxis sp. CP4]
MATPEEQAASMIANMPEKTGKPLEDWVAIVAKSGAAKHGEIVKLLKAEHGMTHGFANLVAHKAREAADGGGETDLVASQYAGPKEALRPIYDAIADFVESLGSNAELAPKKSYVSLRRSKQFGLVQPSTRTRVDLGINLKDVAPVGRLESSGGFNAMVSHRIRLESADDVDDEVREWLRIAYENA